MVEKRLCNHFLENKLGCVYEYCNAIVKRIFLTILTKYQLKANEKAVTDQYYIQKEQFHIGICLSNVFASFKIDDNHQQIVYF